MHLIVCIDNGGGMTFNHRRLSTDRVLRRKLSEISGGRLWMNAYSAGQFLEDQEAEAVVQEDFLEKAPDGEFCFVENLSCLPWEQRMESIILCKWNRVYPSDQKFDIPLKAHGWKCVSVEEFPGSSHDKITMEVYRR